MYNVSKVSTRFEFFPSGFASVSELTLIQVELGAEFDSESNGDIFRPGFRSKNGTSPRNTDFFRFFRKVFGVRIRYSNCSSCFSHSTFTKLKSNGFKNIKKLIFFEILPKVLDIPSGVARNF